MTTFSKTNAPAYSTTPPTWTSSDGRHEIHRIVGAPRPYQVVRVRKPLFSDVTRTFVDSATTLEGAKSLVRGLSDQKARAAAWGWVTSTGSDKKPIKSVEDIKAERRAHWERHFAAAGVLS